MLKEMGEMSTWEEANNPPRSTPLPKNVKVTFVKVLDPLGLEFCAWGEIWICSDSSTCHHLAFFYSFVQICLYAEKSGVHRCVLISGSSIPS